MAAPAVHNKSGKYCKHCGKAYMASSFNITVSRRIDGYIIKESVCGDCHHKYMSRGKK